MKKNRLFVLAALLLACGLILCTAAFGAGDFLFDQAGLLSADEAARYNEEAAKVSAEKGCGVYAATVESYQREGYGNIEAFSESFIKENRLAEGSGGNALLLLVSTEEREYVLTATGDEANRAFTDYGKGQMARVFLDDFQAGSWGTGFLDYVGIAGDYLERAQNSAPVDVPQAQPASQPQQQKGGVRGLFSAIPAAVIAWVTCGAFKSSMKTARTATEARRYTGPDNIQITRSDDFYTHTTTVRQPIERGGSSPGGPGGTSVNSGGFSHSSGKF